MKRSGKKRKTSSHSIFVYVQYRNERDIYTNYEKSNPEV